MDAERIKLIEKAVEQATGMRMGAIMRPTHKWKEATAKRVLFYLLDKAGCVTRTLPSTMALKE